ncbi:MAG: hypothetical protein KJT03_10405 [Verrucomicrobiae bacterium]|nr:hypothetical protein [Verrucomicrobiae bacterium]
MKFGISFEIDHDLQKASEVISRFADDLSRELEKEDFGSDVEDITIGIIWTRTVEGYEDWFKERKPRFRKTQTIRFLDGRTETLKNSFTYDIKFSDSEIEDIASFEARAIGVFCERLLESL